MFISYKDFKRKVSLSMILDEREVDNNGLEQFLISIKDGYYDYEKGSKVIYYRLGNKIIYMCVQIKNNIYFQFSAYFVNTFDEQYLKAIGDIPMGGYYQYKIDRENFMDRYRKDFFPLKTK